MTLKELSQLYYLNREIEMDQKRLENLDLDIRESERQLADLERTATSLSSPNYDGMPKSPSCSNGNKIENDVAKILNLEDSIRRKKALRDDIAMTIQAKQITCLVERNKLERYIADLPDSLLRLIFTYRFINGLTWGQVSTSIGVRTTEESVKKMCYRYLNEQNNNK